MLCVLLLKRIKKNIHVKTNIKIMKKKRTVPRYPTMNELRQNNPHWQPEDGDVDPGKYDGDLAQPVEEERPLDPIFEAKNLIVDKITKHFQDVMFEMICEEMNDNYLFKVDNYFTPAGYDEFEDEWFEFYHEHHGDILYEVMKNITY